MSEERKNLANCKPSEFLAQTNRMRKAVAKWLDVTKISETRKIVPKLAVIPENATKEQAIEIQAENRKLMAEQSKENLSKILDEVLENHPDETLEILALLCFVEPKDVDKHSIAFYLSNIADILNDKDVLSFFTSLAQLEQSGMLKASIR